MKNIIALFMVLSCSSAFAQSGWGIGEDDFFDDFDDVFNFQYSSLPHSYPYFSFFKEEDNNNYLKNGILELYHLLTSHIGDKVPDLVNHIPDGSRVLWMTEAFIVDESPFDDNSYKKIVIRFADSANPPSVFNVTLLAVPSDDQRF